MPDLTTYTTAPRTIPTLDTFNARREAARLAREDQKRARLAHFRQLDRDAQESFNRKPKQAQEKRTPTTENPLSRPQEPQITTCKGTCGRRLRGAHIRADRAPNTARRYRDGKCRECWRQTSPEAAVRPCAGPCKRMTRTRGSSPESAPGTVSRLRDGMCSMCVRGTTPAAPTDAQAVIADYRAGMSIAALKAKHHIGKSTIYVILENTGEPRRRKGSA